MMKKTLFELWNFKKKCLNKCRERERENLLYSDYESHQSSNIEISINKSWINKTKTPKISSVHIQLQVIYTWSTQVNF